MDPEEETFAKLARRVGRVRGLTAGGFVVLGVVSGVFFYLALRELLLAHLLVHIPYLTMMVTIAPSLIAGFFIGRAVGRMITRFRLQAWAVALARQAGLPEARLKEAARIWEED